MHLPGINPVDESELWSPVEGYPKNFVTNYGRVASWFRKNPILRKFTVADNGYLRVKLWRDGKSDDFHVAHLVLVAFKGPCPPGQEACHNDGKRSNNHIKNLRWDTHVENVWDRVEYGNYRLNPAQVAEVKRLISLGYPYDSIANHMEVRVETISNLIYHEFTRSRMEGVKPVTTPKDTRIFYKG
jgi:hypothetical protein